MNEEIQHERMREIVTGHPGRFDGLTVKQVPSKREARLRKLDLTDYSLSQRRLGFDNECAGVCGV